MYDLILKNAHVIDPESGMDEIADVALKDGKIAAIASNLQVHSAEKSCDLTGLYLTPGLVDMHVHCYYTGHSPDAWAGELSLQPDYFSFRGGVTTMVDAGSAGSKNFDHFRTTVFAHSKTKLFAFLNASDRGMMSLEGEQFPDKNDEQAFYECYARNKDVLCGIKIAHYWGKDWAQLEQAQRLQACLDVPIMIDVGNFYHERPHDQLLLEKLRPGDISTHCFRAPVPVIDERGNLYSYLRKAKQRGIWFDLGHGCASFALRNAVPAMRQGFLPDSFSSDMHGENINSTVMSMPQLLSKLLACCDMPLIELFRRVTSAPAKKLGLPGAGCLRVGEEADLAIWSIREGKFGFRDAAGGKILGTRKLECEMTFRCGEAVWDSDSRLAEPYETLGADYGVCAPDEIVRPTL